ncbi:MAG: hypothetical protein GC201_18915 [Alphaproteobacteria bacterium]|nr:hypothetical protein [Alphaproteobacteria bacterium]
MNNETITEDGEIITEDQMPVAMTTSLAVQLQKAEIDQLVTTARAYPRSLRRVQAAILSMATLDQESAEECMYALPRGGKPIKGPSIRFAEILKQSYGNCHSAARVVHVDRGEKYVEAEGVFVDFETNARSTARVRRRISDRNGKVFNDDMIIVTGNAACSIAMRNAILAGVPKPLWRKAYETVQATITGDVTTLAVNREKAIKALAAYGVKPEQIFRALGREGLEDISVDDIATLRGMYAALKNGEATVEEMFQTTVKGVSDHQKVSNPLSDEPAPKEGKKAATEPAEAEAADEATGGEDAGEDNSQGDASADEPTTVHTSSEDGDLAHDEPRGRTEPQGDDASGADGAAQGEMLGGEDRAESEYDALMRKIKSVASEAAIADIRATHQDLIMSLDGDEAIFWENALDAARQRAKVRKGGAR